MKKEDEKKAMICYSLGLLLFISSFYINLLMRQELEALMSEFGFYIFLFGFSLIGGVIFFIGVSYWGYEDVRERKKKLFQVFIVDIILYGLYILLIVLLIERGNYIAYVLLGVMMLLSFFILIYERLKEILNKAKQNQNEV